MENDEIGIQFVGYEQYVNAPLSFVRDARLTWAARGLFLFLSSLPRGWRIRASHLQKMSPAGRDGVRARLGELRKIGALGLDHIMEGGKLRGTRWTIYHPSLWAVAADLSRNGFSDNRAGRASADLPISNIDNKEISSESSSSAPTPTPLKKKPAAAPSAKKFFAHASGIECWDADDIVAADRLAKEHPAEQITAAILAIRARSDKSPAPGMVAREISAQSRRANIKPVQTIPADPPDPAAQARGEELLPASLRRKIKKGAA